MSAHIQPLSGDIVREHATDIGRFVERSLPAGLRLGAHSHDLSLLTVVVSGGFVEQVGGRDQECRPGDVRLLPAGDPHANRVDAASRCCQLVVAASWLGGALDVTGELVVKGPINGELVQAFGARLFQECQRRKDCCEATLEALTLDILSYAGRRAIAEGRKRPSWLDRICTLIDDTYTGSVSLTVLAKEAGVHPVHVSRAFHRFCGCTIGDKIRRLRLQRACALMANSRLSLSTIAFEAGFSDQSHFVRVFRRSLRTTPGLYRQWILKAGK